jgi:hypothetical protein
VADPEFALVSRDRLTPIADAPVGDGTFSSAQDALKRFLAEHPEQREHVQIVRREEVPA